MVEKLGELLVRKGIATQKVVDETLKAQLIYGGRLGTLLVELGHVDVEALGLLLAEQRRFPLAEKKHFESATDFSVLLITAEIAAKHLAFPFAQDGRKLKVAFAAPYDPEAVDAVAFATGMRVVPHIAPEMQLRFYIERRYHVTFETNFIRLAPDGPPPAPGPVSVRALAPPEGENEDDLEEAETFEEMPEGQYLMDQDEDPTTMTGMGAAAYLAMTEKKPPPEQVTSFPKITPASMAAVQAPTKAAEPDPEEPEIELPLEEEEDVPDEWTEEMNAGTHAGNGAPVASPPVARMTPAPTPAIAPITAPTPAAASTPAARMTPAPTPAIAPVSASTPAARMTPAPTPAIAPATAPTPATRMTPAPVPAVTHAGNGTRASHETPGGWATAAPEHHGAVAPRPTSPIPPMSEAATPEMSAAPGKAPSAPSTSATRMTPALAPIQLTQPAAGTAAPSATPPIPAATPPESGAHAKAPSAAPVPAAQTNSAPVPIPPTRPVTEAAASTAHMQAPAGPHPLMPPPVAPAAHPPMPVPPNSLFPRPAPGHPPPGWPAGVPPPGMRPPPPPPSAISRPHRSGLRPSLPFPPPGAVWHAPPSATQPPPPNDAPPPPVALEEAAPPPTATATAPPPKPRVLELETSGDDVPPLMSPWEMLAADKAPAPAEPSDPSPPTPTSDQDLKLAAPWEFVGYQGDAAEDLQAPAAVPPEAPAESTNPTGLTQLTQSTDPNEGPPDPETAAQIADAVANGELDWSSVIAFDGEQPSPAPEEEVAPRMAASAGELEKALEEATSAMKSATQGAMIGEALLAYCQQGFGRAFFFIVQYGVAMFWRGFGPGSDGAVVAFRPELKEPSMFKTAVDSGKPSVVTVPESSIDENFFWAISPPPPSYVVAVPVSVGGVAREILCVVGEESGPSPELLGALERLSVCAAEAHARLSGRP